MLEIFDLNYDELKGSSPEELYRLRKITFKDRLDWAVACKNDMEFDEFDNRDAHYLLGIYDNQLICSVRFIELHLPNMITHTFGKQFGQVELPASGYIESSRFFVDKERAKSLLGNHFPISHIHFLSVINYALYRHYTGIYTIVSRAMLTILKRSGWLFDVVHEAHVNPNEPIYLLRLPATDENQRILAGKIKKYVDVADSALMTWPLSLPVIPEPA